MQVYNREEQCRLKEHKHSTPCRGFTLVEIMVVTTILALLVLIAAPTYQKSVRKSRRTDAMRDLMELGTRQEKFYAKNSTYTTTIDADDGLNLGRTTDNDGYYNLTAAACTDKTIATCYVMKATPTGSQVDDTRCAVLTLDSLGERTATGTLGSGCW
jgi:type IV pilus assembly protein PilE